MAKIAIFGGTGYAGGHIAREAASRGHVVTTVARSAAEPIEGGTHIQGSVTDNDLVRRLAAENDDVVVAAQPEGDITGLAQDLLAAAKAGGARLSFVGGAGSLQVQPGGPALIDTPDFPEEYKAVASAHGDLLDTLKADTTGADWFYVSPAAGFGSWAAGERTGTYRTSDDVLLVDEAGNSTIGGADFALAFVDEIENAQHRNKRFHVAN